MAELNLDQIIEKLNEEFVSDIRKIIFWYDSNCDFIDDIKSISLNNAKIIFLEPNNQFYVKYYLECVDTLTNYLVYAPFEKPPLRENHLSDTILYSQEFYADKATLISMDLGIDITLKPIIQHYINKKFFNDKERTHKFYELVNDKYTKDSIELSLMCVLSGLKTVSIEEVLRKVLSVKSDNSNSLLEEFEKYDLIKPFWQQIDENYGYNDNYPTLDKLLICLFITYASRIIKSDLPEVWQPYLSYKAGNIMVFLDNMMNNSVYIDCFDRLSYNVFKLINGEEILKQIEIRDLTNCFLFENIDIDIIKWIVSRLLIEDIGAKADSFNIPDLCSYRRKMHFGKKYENAYFILENAYFIIKDSKYETVSGIQNIVNNYLTKYFTVDRRYRYFYYYYDKIHQDFSMFDISIFEELRILVENIYTNVFLNKITVNWNQEISTEHTNLPLQRNFYSQFLSGAKEKTVVLISDALRYEVAASILDRFNSDEKCKAKLQCLEGVLPSYTPLGMASLLPHKKIEYTDTYEVLIDGKPCATTEQRENILKLANHKSRCIQYDNINNLNMPELRSVFNGQDIVYVYHNQIDAIGDAAKTENQVFSACESSIQNIYDFIRKLSSQANVHHFYVTADHGFIYKRDKIEAKDKIGGVVGKSNSIGQRYCVSNESIDSDGVCYTTVGEVLGTDDKRYVSYPLASDIFKVPGAGQNFVHGGCSPQEMIVPLLEVKVEEGKKDISFAEIQMPNSENKITNHIKDIEFFQTEPVSDLVKKATYHVYFITDDNEKLSNEIIHIANSKETQTSKRFFSLRFNLKTGRYDKSRKYYLVAKNEETGFEIIRREFIIDFTFNDDYGF